MTQKASCRDAKPCDNQHVENTFTDHIHRSHSLGTLVTGAVQAQSADQSKAVTTQSAEDRAAQHDEGSQAEGSKQASVATSTQDPGSVATCILGHSRVATITQGLNNEVPSLAEAKDTLTAVDQLTNNTSRIPASTALTR